MKSLVSVIMPTYNHARYLSESISSVLNQSYRDWELIIIDNYSQDDTESVVREYAGKDPRIRYFQFSNNGIIAASRNHGIRQAQGEYVAFLDSDDIWMPEKLDEQMKVFEGMEGTGLVYSRAVGFTDDGRHLHVMPKKIFSGNVFNRLLKNNFIGCSTVLVKNNILEEIGIFDVRTDLVSVEDYELWLRIARHNKAVGLNQILVKYRIHSQAVSMSQEVERELRPLHALDSVFEKLQVSPPVQKRIKSRWYATLARKALYKGHFKEFKYLSEKGLHLNFFGLALLQHVMASLMGRRLLQKLTAKKKKKRAAE